MVKFTHLRNLGWNQEDSLWNDSSIMNPIIVEETESIVKISSQREHQYQIVLLANSTKGISSKFFRIQKEATVSNSFFEAGINLILNLDKVHIRNRMLISFMNIHVKNPKENSNKLNSAIYKKNNTL